MELSREDIQYAICEHKNISYGLADEYLCAYEQKIKGECISNLENIIKKEIKANTIDEFAQRIIDEIQLRQYDGEFCKEHHIEVSICTIIATIAIKEIAEQMKGDVKNGNQ